jgi:hypothetical protein
MLLLLAGLAATTACANSGVDPSQVSSVRVLTATNGTNLDPNGYHVTLSGVPGVHIGINDTVTFTGVVFGDKTLTLDSVATNCTVQNGASHPVFVPAGGSNFQAPTFNVTCS